MGRRQEVCHSKGRGRRSLDWKAPLLPCGCYWRAGVLLTGLLLLLVVVMVLLLLLLLLLLLCQALDRHLAHLGPHCS
jgi:hypothetical protein